MLVRKIGLSSLKDRSRFGRIFLRFLIKLISVKAVFSLFPYKFDPKFCMGIFEK
jgi:hypothetical protein